jgi:hypothetical protein
MMPFIITRVLMMLIINNLWRKSAIAHDQDGRAGRVLRLSELPDPCRARSLAGAGAGAGEGASFYVGHTDLPVFTAVATN